MSLRTATRCCRNGKVRRTLCSSCLFRSQGHCVIINIYTSKVKSCALDLSHYLRRFYLRLHPSVFTCYFFCFCGLIRGSIPRYIVSNSGIQPSNNFISYLTALIENAYYFCYYFLLPFFLLFLFFFYSLFLLFFCSLNIQNIRHVPRLKADPNTQVYDKSVCFYMYMVFCVYIYIYIFFFLINTTRFTLDCVCMSFAVIWINGGNFRTRRVGGSNKQQ